MSSINKLPSGNWRARVYIGKDNAGKPLYKSITAPTKKEALYKAREYELMSERLSSPINMTLGEAIDSYINSKSNVLSPATIRGYKMIRKNQMQCLMNKPIISITQLMIQQAVNIEALKYNPKTVKNSHGLVSAALAVYRPDFALHTTLPKKHKTERHLPSDEDIARLVDIVKGSDIYIPVLLACILSLRRSEISGLLWSDVDFSTGKLSVRRAMVLDDQKNWVIKNPKTFNSFREITMPGILISELQKVKGDLSAPVINLNPSQITDQFKRIIAKNNFEHFRFHDLRHYNASVMLALNLPDKYAMERGGWSNPATMKNIYQHTFKEKHNQYDDLIATYFNSILKINDTDMTQN